METLLFIKENLNTLIFIFIMLIGSAKLILVALDSVAKLTPNKKDDKIIGLLLETLQEITKVFSLDKLTERLERDE